MSDVNALEQPSENPESASVYDFLYHDARRVGSFLAQFEMHGVRSQVKHTKNEGRDASLRKTGTGEAGIPPFVKGQVGMDWTVGTDSRELAEYTYDPLWANARRLLDYLTEHDLIRRDLWTARLGQFVLASGTLVMLDVATFKEAWQKAGVKQFVASGVLANAEIPPGLSKAQEQAAKAKAKAETELLIDMLTVLPHLIQAQLFGNGTSVWCSLNEGSLVGPPSDVVLKHGSFLQGEWSMLGILDADPDPKREVAPDGTPQQDPDEVVADLTESPIGKMTAQLAPLTRMMLGRPRRSFGVTPLLIFREVRA